MLFGVLGILSAGPVMAEQVSASRAKVELASVNLSTDAPRQCYARYSLGTGKTRNGTIEEVAFRVPCPEVMSTRFIETLQRALAARDHYEGPITGRADSATREAVQSYQRANGFNSPVLTLETAQRLGLVPIEVTQN